MKRRLVAVLILALGAGVVGTATAVVGGDDNTLNPAAVEPKKPAVDELVDDPEAGKPPTYGPNNPTDRSPVYEPGAAKVVAPDSEIGRKLNPHADPNMRICQKPDGGYVVIQTTPIPGKNPYPNDPEDLRSRAC
jgi:hypothetical protein